MAPAVITSAFLSSLALSSTLPESSRLQTLPDVSGLKGIFADSVSACPALPPRATAPDNVNDLRPDDFKVFMAMGDSITAGFGARGLRLDNPFKNLFEARGSSFAIGGDPGTLSVSNFFKQFSPSIRQPSTGERLLQLCSGHFCPWIDEYNPEDGFNAAKSGATTAQLPKELEILVRTVGDDDKVDMQRDWKYVNLLIGANDQCGACRPNALSADEYERRMRGILDGIHANFPRTVVNVLSVFKVSQVWDVTKNNGYCKFVRGLGLDNLCSCAFKGGDSSTAAANRRKMDDAVDSWNGRLEKIRKDYLGKYNDFAVVVDHGSGGAPVTKFKSTLISSMDCFHPSLEAHQFFAKATWNNLFLPADRKSQSHDPAVPTKIYCPTAEDRIQVV